ncbi:MAG: hypothetical protein PF638_16130 [Candidatus Delongbacteria bacterium]|jgi:hypothetical protein|nr:hypothetical protein [Candidatus Delongbacteria bacterium]
MVKQIGMNSNKLVVTICVVLLILFMGCSNMSKGENSLSEYNLKGKVKSLKATSFSVKEKFGEISKGLPNYSINSEFNEDGNITSQTVFFSGEISSKEITEYNVNGNKIKNIRYDSKGNISKITEWNEFGDITMTEKFKSDGTITKTTKKYNYNKDGYKINCKNYDHNGELWLESKYIYNENLEIIKIVGYSEDVLVKEEIYEYDNDGNNIKYTLSYGDNIAEQRTFEYKNGHIVKSHNIEYDDDGNIDSEHSSETEYDENGNEIMQKSNTTSGMSISSHDSYSYEEFDSYNNWIKKIKHPYNSEKVIGITEREIQYYK